MIGGSTDLNLLAWDRGSKTEYDAWAQFMDQDECNHDSLLSFFKESETLSSLTGGFAYSGNCLCNWGKGDSPTYLV